MKRKLTYLLILLTCFGFTAVMGQTTIATGLNGTTTTAGPVITFAIQNNNAAAIIVTDVAHWHLIGNNGATYTLWYSTTQITGAPTIAAPNWTQFYTGAPVTTAASGTTTVISGMSLFIPGNTLYRIAIVQSIGNVQYSSTGLIPYSAGGVDLICGNSPISPGYTGAFPTPGINGRWICGGITFNLATPCAGQPTAGNAVARLGCPANISLANSSAGTTSGLTIQWQQRQQCTSTWTNIPNANGASLPISSPGNPTDYRAYMICNNSNLADTSTPVNVSSISPCYCTPSITSAVNDDIHKMTLGNFTNATGCASLAPGPGTIINRYSNYSTLPAIDLPRNSTTPFSLLSGNCGATNLTYGVAVFIDLNRNGTYEATENLYSTTNAITTPVNVSGNITIPPWASIGVTGMRVILASGTPGSSISACGTYTDGEIEDYVVNILSTPDATGGGFYCSGQNVTLTMSAPGVPNPQLLWKLPDGTFSTSTTIQLNNIQTSQSGNYIAYLLTNNCPGLPPDTSGGRIMSVLVNQSPLKPVVAPVIVYCQGKPFDSIPIHGQDLKWYPVPTGGIPTIFPPVINTSQGGSVTYYVSQTMNNCESARSPVTINVVPKPVPPQVVTPVGYCQGDAAIPLVANGQNVRWYSVPVGGVGTPVTPTPGTNAQGTFTWYATQTVAGCESQRTPVVVSVSYVPNAMIITHKEFVCQYDTIHLSYFGNANTLASYLWSLPGGASIVSGSGQGPLVVRFDSAGNYTVKLTVDNKGCAGPQATKNITVRLAPKFSLELAEDACKGDIVNIAVNYSTTGIDKYEWFGFDGGEVIYGSPTAGPYGIRWNTPGVKVIKVEATDEGCKSLPFSDTIEVHEQPDASILTNKNNICAGDTVEFRGVFEQGNSYSWEPFEFFGASNAYIDSGIVDFTTYIKLNVTNRYNCRATDSVLISAQPCCKISFPNAFTPNNDGRNDLFRAITIGTHQITDFRVHNRWGQMVFETGDELTGWDGSFNGKPQDMGTYFYYIKYKCADGNYYEAKGELMLLR